MATINDLWEGYAAATLPADCPAVQRRETRRAFFAGAFALLTEMRVAAEGELSDEEGEGLLAAWERECVAFYERVKAGKA